MHAEEIAREIEEAIESEIERRLIEKCPTCERAIYIGILNTICSVVNDKSACKSVIRQYKTGDSSLEDTIIELKNRLGEEDRKTVKEVIDFISNYEKEHRKKGKKRRKG